MNDVVFSGIYLGINVITVVTIGTILLLLLLIIVSRRAISVIMHAGSGRIKHEVVY